MMETLSLVLAATASVLVLLIIGGNVYLVIRPKFSKRVTCWFCHKRANVPYDKRACWDCPSCGQYNGFSADGGYNKVIPAQHVESLNNRVVMQKPKEHKVSTDNGLCVHCNANQQLKIHQLSSFSPSNPDRYDDEVEEFRARLEDYYRLCDSCEAVLKKTLKKQASWILGLQLNGLKKQALLHKDSIVKRFGRLHVTAAAAALFFRYMNVVLASWLVVCIVAHLVDPSFGRIPLTPGIHAVLRFSFPDLPGHIPLPEVLGSLIQGTLAFEMYLTAIGMIIQLAVGLRQTRLPGGSRQKMEVLCSGMWALSHGLYWVMVSGAASSWISNRILKTLHASFAFAVLLGSVASTFKFVRPEKKPSKTFARKKHVSKDGLDFSDSEEMEKMPRSPSVPFPTKTQTTPEKGQSAFSPCIVSTATANITKFKSQADFHSKSLKVNTTNDTSQFTSTAVTSDDDDITSQLDSKLVQSDNNSVDGFKNFSRLDMTSVPDKGRRNSYKTKSRVVKSTRSPLRKSPSDITDMLNSSVGNISLPIQTPAEDTYSGCSSQNLLPLDIDNGLSNLKLGSPLKDVGARQRLGSDDGYMELFKGCNSTSSCRRRSVLSPSRFQPRTNVARSSWVAGGFWQAPRLADTPTGTDLHSPLSRSSSQSSGFISQSSQLPNSRSSSICSADCDVQSVTSERCGSGFYHSSSPTLDGKNNVSNPLESRSNLIYNMSGGFNYPRSISSDVGLDSSFSSSKNLVFPENEHQSYLFHGDRTIRYPTSLFSPQPFYFQQSFPSQYLSTYGSRFCYPQQFAMPPLWNPSAFAPVPQQQLCISAPLGDTSRSSSRCSETKEPFEFKSPKDDRFSRLKTSVMNVLIIVTLVCSLFYNAVYSGWLSLRNPG